MARQVEKFKTTDAQKVLLYLRATNTFNVKQCESKLAAAQGATAILKEATNDENLQYEFIFVEVRGEGGCDSIPEMRLNTSGSYQQAWREARAKYKKKYTLRAIKAECIVWVDFPNHYRIMLPDSFTRTLVGKKK